MIMCVKIGVSILDVRDYLNLLLESEDVINFLYL